MQTCRGTFSSFFSGLFFSSLLFAIMLVPHVAWSQDAESTPAPESEPAAAATPQPQGEARSTSLQDLEKRVRSLEAAQEQQANSTSPESEDLTKLRLELSLPEPLGPSFTGLGTMASRIYSSRMPSRFGGLGEVHYTSENNGPRSTNLTRLNLAFGHRFSKNLVFNSSLLHEGGGSSGSPYDTRVAYAYLDFLFNETAGLRAGNVLIPFGVTNLRFEPTQYPMVNRPHPEQTLFPATWNENGLIAFGKIGSVVIQAGVVNSGDISKASASSWIREGGQSGAQARAEDPAWVFRAEHYDSESSLGASIYGGQWSQGNAALGRSAVLMGEVHASIKLDRFSAQALYIEGKLSDTERIFAVTGQSLGSRARGAVVALSYDLLPPLSRATRAILESEPATTFRELPVFVSWEHDHVQAELEPGLASNATSRTNIYTIGANYKPHEEVVIKADFAYQDSTTISRVIETAIAYSF